MGHDTTRATRQEAGQCAHCARPSGEHALCAHHRREYREAYAARRAAGRCVACGRKASGYACQEHTEQRNAARAARRARTGQH